MTETNDSIDHEDPGAAERTGSTPSADASFTGQPEGSTAASIARRSIGFSLLIAAVVLVLDQITKHWAVNALDDGASRQVLWKLHWNLAYNSGMAFSRAQGIGPYIGALALVVVVVLVLSLRRSTSRTGAVAVGLVVGGACGNLTDRLFRDDGWLHGKVVDFIDFEFWPIFNVADMGVCIGGALFVIAALFDGRQTAPGPS